MIFPPKYQSWLASFVRKHGASAGSVHVHLGGFLELAAALHLPLQLRQKVLRVPRGQGLAGQALETGEPVRSRDLDDGDGAAGQGTVALPVLDGAGGVRAVVGLTFDDERELGSQELDALARSASSLPAF